MNIGSSEVLLLISGFIFLMLMAGIIVLIVFLVKKTTTIKNESQQKEVAKMKLNAVRAQLNPHFMFNALAGIQNLMNKNEIDNANRYLGKFARLTRNVLDAKELITIADELRLLDDYLQMEQLRFGFTYVISTQPELDIDNIEIPSMLVQPFAENAVKHGMASLKGPGNIELSFYQKDSDLLIKVKDNGHGIKNTQGSGQGIKLMQNRISLYNSINKDTKLKMDTVTGHEGTSITITLTNWL